MKKFQFFGSSFQTSLVAEFADGTIKKYVDNAINNIFNGGSIANTTISILPTKEVYEDIDKIDPRSPLGPHNLVFTIKQESSKVKRVLKTKLFWIFTIKKETLE